MDDKDKDTAKETYLEGEEGNIPPTSGTGATAEDLKATEDAMADADTSVREERGWTPPLTPPADVEDLEAADTEDAEPPK